MAERLLTPEEAASRLAVSPKSIREWLRTGKLKGVKAGRLWRIREHDIYTFLGKAAPAARVDSEDPILKVAGCLSGKPLTAREMEKELYGKDLV